MTYIRVIFSSYRSKIKLTCCNIKKFRLQQFIKKKKEKIKITKFILKKILNGKTDIVVVINLNTLMIINNCHKLKRFKTKHEYTDFLFYSNYLKVFQKTDLFQTFLSPILLISNVSLCLNNYFFL